MQIKITYPVKKRRRNLWKLFCELYTILFITSIFVCPLVNLVVGGKLWCIVAVMGAYTVWVTFIYPSLFELNRISQFIKFLLCILVEILFIDVFLGLGDWGLFVVPIVSFGGLIIAAILFFSDFERQRHHAIPFILLTIASLAAGIVGICLEVVKIKWVFIVLASVALFFLITSIVTLRVSIIQDLKKKFNTK